MPAVDSQIDAVGSKACQFQLVHIDDKVGDRGMFFLSETDGETSVDSGNYGMSVFVHHREPDLMLAFLDSFESEPGGDGALRVRDGSLNGLNRIERAEDIQLASRDSCGIAECKDFKFHKQHTI